MFSYLTRPALLLNYLVLMAVVTLAQLYRASSLLSNDRDSLWFCRYCSWPPFLSAPNISRAKSIIIFDHELVLDHVFRTHHDFCIGLRGRCQPARCEMETHPTCSHPDSAAAPALTVRPHGPCTLTGRPPLTPIRCRTQTRSGNQLPCFTTAVVVVKSAVYRGQRAQGSDRIQQSSDATSAAAAATAADVASKATGG